MVDSTGTVRKGFGFGNRRMKLPTMFAKLKCMYVELWIGEMTSGIFLATNVKNHCNISLYCLSFFRHYKTDHNIKLQAIYTHLEGTIGIIWELKVKVARKNGN